MYRVSTCVPGEICGVVMQDGKLFSETILANIVLDDEHIDYDHLHKCQMAQIEDEINGMPKGFDTVIGKRRTRNKRGQKQRLLIARALYRNQFIPIRIFFLDEAANSLTSSMRRRLLKH